MTDVVATDGGRGESEPLLPGENRNSHLPDDAEHWIAVYSEFIRFKADLLSSAVEERTALSDEVSAALSMTVLSQLNRQYERLQRRLDFWQTRLAELTTQP